MNVLLNFILKFHANGKYTTEQTIALLTKYKLLELVTIDGDIITIK